MIKLRLDIDEVLYSDRKDTDFELLEGTSVLVSPELIKEFYKLYARIYVCSPV